MKTNPKKNGKPAISATNKDQPDAWKLAQLAAAVAPDAAPDTALDRAMRLYVQSVLFCRDLPVDFNDLVRRYGNEGQSLRIMAEPLERAAAAELADTVELDPKADNDAARSFLAKMGLQLKTSRSVLEGIRRYWQGLPSHTFLAEGRPSVDTIITQCKRDKNGRVIYAIPKRLLEGVVSSAVSRRGESKRKGWKTRQKKSSA